MSIDLTIDILSRKTLTQFSPHTRPVLYRKKAVPVSLNNAGCMRQSLDLSLSPSAIFTLLT